jgi:uncharacterized protein YndB with AHSA1/START domain
MGTDQLVANAPFVIERIFNASITKVWNAITNKDEMKKWYFDLKEFKPQVGFEFQFSAGEEGKEYLHRCKVTEVIPGKKITYSWSYNGYAGMSYVTFELSEINQNKTKLTLRHTGLETFPTTNPDFAKSNFERGWNEIIGKILKDFLESSM